ncbi:MAG: PepSY domain-containing protein [Thiohalomonadaceae bacterium]
MKTHASDRFRRAAAACLLALGLAAAALPISLQARARTIVPLETIHASALGMHPGEPLRVELERKKGREFYRVEILDATDDVVWKMEFDAYTGELLKEEAETEHDHARRLQREGSILPLETVVRSAKAMRAGDLLEVELEHAHGRYIYEVEILDPQGKVWELRFDAHDGKFLREEVDD